MSGLSGFRHEPGVRRLPRLGTTGGHPVFVSVPRLPGRRSRGAARSGPGRGVVSWKFFTTWALVGRTLPALCGMALRPAAPALPAPPRRRRTVRRPAARLWGAARRPCRRPADNGPSAPSRGAGKAAASSRCALPSRRESVVTTVELARLGSDDALRRRINGPEIRAVRGFLHFGRKEPKNAGKCQAAKTRFFRPRQKSFTPEVRPCSQGEIGCPVNGAWTRFAAPLLDDRLSG